MSVLMFPSLGTGFELKITYSQPQFVALLPPVEHPHFDRGSGARLSVIALHDPISNLPLCE